MLQPFSHVNEHFNRLQLSVERVRGSPFQISLAPERILIMKEKKHSVSLSAVKERQISNILSPNSI